MIAAPRETDPEALAVLEETRRLVDLWRPRMGVAETVNVESIDDDGVGDRQLEAKCVPLERDAAGMWVFTMSLVAKGAYVEDLERIVVHELVHVILEPLRATYLGAKATFLLLTPNPKDVFAGASVGGDLMGKAIVMPPGSDLKEIISAPSLTTWETVIDRIADAFLRAPWTPAPLVEQLDS